MEEERRNLLSESAISSSLITHSLSLLLLRSSYALAKLGNTYGVSVFFEEFVTVVMEPGHSGADPLSK